MHYIHYGSPSFNISTFEPIINLPRWNKPDGGLWASPKDSDNDWYNWCICNNFKLNKLEKSFEFDISQNAKILKIHAGSDLRKLEPYDYSFHKWNLYPDFEAITQDGYDAMEVFINDDDIYFKLYGWDCDTLLVFNPEVMIF